MITVEQVTTKKQQKEFIEFPLKLYKGNKCYTPALYSDEKKIFRKDDTGTMVSIGKETGRAKAIARLVNYVVELGDDVKGHRVLIGHTDVPEIAAEAERQLKEKFGDDLNVIIHNVNPTIGSHCGPNALGICFHAIHR